ncbi:MAG TPA: hypothetical protein VGM07_05110 [Stellaceae bacterium]|jgi:hypothetical protein
MKWRELAIELDAAISAVGEPERRRLVDLGIPEDLLGPKLPMIGIAQIKVSRSLLYEPSPDGWTALITPVLIDSPMSPEAANPVATARYAGDLVDLVAWRPDRPSLRATRTGAATWLGAIAPQYLPPAPAHVWRSVLKWFRARLDGLVLLSDDPVECWRLLDDCQGGIVPEDAGHAAELRVALARPWASPRVRAA